MASFDWKGSGLCLHHRVAQHACCRHHHYQPAAEATLRLIESSCKSIQFQNREVWENRPPSPCSVWVCRDDTDGAIPLSPAHTCSDPIKPVHRRSCRRRRPITQTKQKFFILTQILTLTLSARARARSTLDHHHIPLQSPPQNSFQLEQFTCSRKGIQVVAMKVKVGEE